MGLSQGRVTRQCHRLWELEADENNGAARVSVKGVSEQLGLKIVSAQCPILDRLICSTSFSSDVNAGFLGFCSFLVSKVKPNNKNSKFFKLNK